MKGNSAICVDPDDHNTVYVGTGYLGRGNVYRSLDGGMNWNSNNVEEWNGLFGTNAAVLTVACESGTDYVWIGTEGKGALFAADGENFGWGGKLNSGPTPDPANIGDGTVSNFAFSDRTRNETWTITYVVPDNAQASEPQPAASNTGTGDMSSVQTSEDTITESWTVRCIDPVTETWSVSGTVSGIQPDPATTGTKYVSDNDEISFTIYAGATDFVVGDKFTFDTTAPYAPYWIVSGALSGTQGNKAYTDMPYSSDNDEIIFTIHSGNIPFEEGDGFEFSVLESGLGVGKTVTEIVQSDVTGTLYAATPSGVYKSEDKGLVWNKTTRFTNDIINTLALYPDLSGGGDNIVYVGTENGGVWFSDDGGTTWEQIWAQNSLNKNMGKGLSATVPVPSVNNEGNGTMSNVTVGLNTQSEFWTVRCIDPVTETWSVIGTVSGIQTNQATTGTPYSSDNNEIAFIIYAGATDFYTDDIFTFTTTRDPGRTIKDLLVDKANNRLYALTYFFGPLEPYHAVGNIYTIELDPTNNYKPKDDWEEANDNLPEFAPPNDKTLFAQYCIAADNPSSPNWLLIGGEGINMYKATSGIGVGNPNWIISKSGLSNLIMSRMPALFSNRCTMSVIESTPDPLSPNDKLFRVYIQDENGNPPIKGSIFQIKTYDFAGVILPFVEDLVYPDTLVYQGTFSDPGNALTNNPFEYRITVYPGVNMINRVNKVEFIFTPECDEVSPGCSGSSVVKTFTY